jgi:serine/threonine-protein kinase
VWDLTRATLARVTFDPGPDQSPVWTPDSRRLLFSSARGGGVLNLYGQAADNTGTIARLTTSPNRQVPTSISPDGTRVLFTTNQDIGLLTLTPGAAPPPQALLQTPFNERNAEVSPDGRWIAYESDESGARQVYVRPFPKVDTGHWQVSTAGTGTRPLWARSGRELFYWEVTGQALMAVAVQTAGAIFSAGTPTKLFGGETYYSSNLDRTYDVSADGQRFLMITDTASGTNAPATSPSLVVVEHWTEELKAKLPAK